VRSISKTVILCSSVYNFTDLEAMMKKHPSRILQLADRDRLTSFRSRGTRANDDDDDGDGGTLNLDFVNVVKLSEDQSASPEHIGQSEAYIS